jgi:FMN phosphatase YigB (HAD superfamily)
LQIFLERGDVAGAVQLLDSGLAFNFRVREHPVYHLAKAKVEKLGGRNDVSLELLKNALELKAFSSKWLAGEHDFFKFIFIAKKYLFCKIYIVFAIKFLRLCRIQASGRRRGTGGD